MKIVAMIPARLGSQRIPKKNLRLLGGRTLVEWVIDACKKCNYFDSIYVNSESDIFEKITADHCVLFYKRPEYLSSHSATNDEFSLDFINSIKPDVLIQVNPTSPFTKPKDIIGVVEMLIDKGLDTVHTVKEEQIEAIFKDMPLNFRPREQMPPSQELEPIKLFTSSIMAWRAEKFKENMLNDGCAVYGGNGKIGYYKISGAGAIDIDNEKDFALAEAILFAEKNKPEVKYYEI